GQSTAGEARQTLRGGHSRLTPWRGLPLRQLSHGAAGQASAPSSGAATAKAAQPKRRERQLTAARPEPRPPRSPRPRSVPTGSSHRLVLSGMVLILRCQPDILLTRSSPMNVFNRPRLLVVSLLPLFVICFRVAPAADAPPQAPAATVKDAAMASGFLRFVDN